jgi:cytochrome P450
MELEWFLPLRGNGEPWREGRKLVDRSLRPSATSSYRWIIEEKTRGFLGQLLAAPGHFHDQIELLEFISLESYDLLTTT